VGSQGGLMQPDMVALANHGRWNVQNIYSLYDALVSINVPSDRARAVVDSLERDMFSQLVTRTEFKTELQLIRQEITAARDLLSKDIQATHERISHQTTVMTVRLGSMIGAGFVLLYALQRLG
jgi:hypothetical protein